MKELTPIVNQRIIDSPLQNLRSLEKALIPSESSIKILDITEDASELRLLKPTFREEADTALMETYLQKDKELPVKRLFLQKTRFFFRLTGLTGL